MKTKLCIIFSFCLMLIGGVSNPLNAAVKVEVQGDQLHVQTDQIGVAGLQGCEEQNLREVPAFLFNLYQKDISQPKDGVCENSKNWIIVSQLPKSNSGKAIFKNLQPGIYKIVCYYGEAKGCDLSDLNISKTHPKQAIVYKKDIPQEVTIQGASTQSLESENSKRENLSFEIYPNPANDIVSISLKEGVLASNISITVFDLLGRVVIDARSQRRLSNCDYQCQLNVKELPAGAFLIRIEDSEGQLLHQQKIMVIRD